MSAPCRISPITRSVSPKRAAVQSASPCTSTTSKQKGTSNGSSLVADETGAYRKIAVFPRGLVHVKVQFTSVRAECAQGDAGDRDAVAHITEIAAYSCSVSQSIVTENSANDTPPHEGASSVFSAAPSPANTLVQKLLFYVRTRTSS